MKTNIPILSYLSRYWHLLALLTLAIFLVQSEALFQRFGMFVYIPAGPLAAVVLALLIRHLFFRQTLDLDVHSGDFVMWWKALPPRDRVLANLSAMAVLFLGSCLVIAAVIK